jgi:hypothetical protein
MAQLGAERLMDPVLLATLWQLRQRLLHDLGASAAAEEMLVDMAVLSYATALRVNALVGNAVLTTEHQLFGDEAGPHVRFRKKHGAEVAERLSVPLGGLDHRGEVHVLVVEPRVEVGDDRIGTAHALPLVPLPTWGVGDGSGRVPTVLVGLLAWLLVGAAVALPLGRFIRAGNPSDESAQVDARAPRRHERTAVRRAGPSTPRRTARLGPA